MRSRPASRRFDFLHLALGVDGHPGRRRAGFAGGRRGRGQLRGGVDLAAGALDGAGDRHQLAQHPALVVIHVRP